APGELRVALEAGFSPDHISVNGVPKDEAHLRRSVEAGVRITIDGPEEVPVLERLVRTTGRPAQVRLRLKPVVSEFVRKSDFAAEGLVPSDLAAIAYKGGLSTEEAVEAGRRILRCEGLELTGFHQHHGRHHASTQWWVAQMRAFAREIGRVCGALGGFRPREIDIGGGFAIPRDPHNAATDYAAPFALAALHAASLTLHHVARPARYPLLSRALGLFESRPGGRRAPSVEAYAEACTRTLREELPRHGIDPEGLELQLEPGRAIHGNAGVHLTTVRSVKRMRSPVPWTVVAVDTTEFWLAGGRFEHHLHEFRVASRMGAPPVEVADVVGRSCYGDRILPAVRVPRLEPGDLLALLDTGAYQEVSCSNFNAMPRPASVLVTGGRAALVRAAETEEDVFRRDRVPDHLRRSEPAPTG
ncbi:MAG: hypothetical protein D6739_08695, partial [Nitrospirae bacterium]